MKKGLKLLFGTLLGFCAVGGACAVIASPIHAQNAVIVLAEGEESETSSEEEVFECSVVVEETKNGSVSVDKTAGHVGEIVTVTAKHDTFYLLETISVNGTALIENEEESGIYSFALVEGENKITAKFVINEELLGSLATMVDQAKNKDWTNLFSLENVFRLVSLVLSSGLLFAMVRVFVKDKKIAKTVEKTTRDTVEKVIPNMTKDTVVQTIQEVIAPIVENMAADNQEMMKAMSVFAKCMALSQENTPEARRAILDELSTLKIGDLGTIEEAKAQIAAFIDQKMKELGDMLAQIKEVKDFNTEIAEETAPEEIPEEEPETGDDGTQF